MTVVEAFERASPATTLLGRLGVWSNFDHIEWADVVDFAKRTESLGYDTLWLNEVSGREPFAALGALAVATERITLTDDPNDDYLAHAALQADAYLVTRDDAAGFGQVDGVRFGRPGAALRVIGVLDEAMDD